MSKQVNAINALERKFWKRVDKRGPDECWIWTGGRGGGKRANLYGRFWIAPRKSYYAHRFSWELANGHPGDMQVCHRCDVPLCVNPAHMFLGTQADNDADRDRKGRCQKGERHFRSSVTEEQVLEMRTLRAAGAKLQDLATRYGVVFPAVSLICTGRAWKHVGGPLTKHSRKLTDDQVREMRSMYKASTKMATLAAKFAVSELLVYYIVNGKYYVDVR